MNVNDLFKASFGQFGSVYLNGDGAKLDLNASNTTRFVIAIQFMEDTTFEDIQTLDGLVGSISDVSAELDVGGEFGAVTNESTTSDQDTITTSHTFPKGVTIYGKWDYIELNGGSCICYLAPVGY
jgi:hypothetical protein|tara:strand:- start:110 stop:484 length:375 start_codon:yes stop_codon:yes gene_type:complete